MIGWKKNAAILGFLVSTAPLGVACASEVSPLPASEDAPPATAEASEMLDEDANAPRLSSREAETDDATSVALRRPPFCEIICQRRFQQCLRVNIYNGPPNPAADDAVIRMCNQVRMQCLRSCRGL